MKWLIASDIHGSARYCEKLVCAFHRENADRMLILGDVLYHGPRNNLPGEYDPKSVISILNSIADRITCVRGNCDTEVDQMVLDFPIMAEYAIIDLGDRIVFATHGHNFNRDILPPLHTGDILLSGHTHVPAYDTDSEILFFNPGSVSIPKENSCHGYMTLAGRTFEWKALDGSVYHTLEL